MSTDDFQKRLQRIHKVSTPDPVLQADGDAGIARPGGPTADPGRNLPVNKILGGSLVLCVIAAIGIVAVFGMGSFRSGGEETAEVEAPKPVVRRMN